MDVVAGRKTRGVEVFGTSTTVPSNCWSRLMYYLYCVNYCLKDDGEDLIPRELRDYEKRYYSLSDEEKLAILALCSGPLLITNLTGKILFKVDKLEEHNNKFLKITETTELVALGIRADRVVGIGGSSKEVTTIMVMTEAWANQNFFTALKEAIRSIGGRNEPAFAPYQSGSSSPSYYSESPSEKSCAFLMCQCALAVPILLILLANKYKYILLFIIGFVIMAYLSAEVPPIFFEQEDAFDASRYSSWPNGTLTASVFLNVGQGTYIKVYFDSSGVNGTANALACDDHDLTFARGRYSWWYRQYKPLVNGVTDLLSKDSFVYFRIPPSGSSQGGGHTITFTGVHSTSGSTDWTTIQWVQQLWFYGLLSLGAPLCVIPGCIVYYRRKNN